MWRRPREALEAVQKALDLEPDHAHALRLKATMLIAMSRNAEALALHERVMAIAPDDIWNFAWRANARFRSGQTDAARATVKRLEQLDEHGWVPPMAFVFASDHIETRLDWLERSFEARDFWLVNLEFEATFDDLREEPRFQAVVDKVHEATKR